MDQFKSALKNFKNNKLLLFVFLVASIASLAVVYLVFTVMSNFSDTKDALRDYESKFSEAYIVVDSTSKEDFAELIQDSTKVEGQFKNLFDRLNKENIHFYTSFAYDMYEDHDGNMIRQQTVTEGFFDVFNLPNSRR